MPTPFGGDATWDITSLEPGEWEKWGGAQFNTPPSPVGGVAAYGAGLLGYGRDANVPQTPYSPLKRRRSALQMGGRGGMQLQGPNPYLQPQGGAGAEGWGGGSIGAATGQAAAGVPYGGMIGRARGNAVADRAIQQNAEPNIRALLGQYQDAFNPNDGGWEQYLTPILQRENDALERRDLLSADLESGGDPTLRAYAGLQSRLNASSRMAGSLQDARFQHREQVMEWLRNLYASYIGSKPYAKKPGTDWGAIGGQIAGAAAGAAAA